MRKPTMWFPTRSNTVTEQSLKQARGWEFWIKKVEELYYPYSENKGADQLCSNCEADLHLCFRLCKMLVFSWQGSYVERLVALVLYVYGLQPRSCRDSILILATVFLGKPPIVKLPVLIAHFFHHSWTNALLQSVEDEKWRRNIFISKSSRYFQYQIFMKEMCES